MREALGENNRLVIVGAGHAGGRLAESLRAHGFAGRIVLVGEETTPPYERPPLSKGYLAGTEGEENMLVRPRDWYSEQGVDLRLGQTAERIDRARRQVVLAGGDRIGYDRLILATGARPRLLHIPGANHSRIHYLRTAADADALRGIVRPGVHVILLGAGVIGLEVASTARKLGAGVTVLECGERPMARVAPATVGDRFTALHQREGVDLRFGQAVTAVRNHAGGVRVETSAGDSHDGDLLIAGIGVLPNVELAAKAGLEVDDGIVVDVHCRTSDPAILAIGDAAAYPNPLLGSHIRLETWQNAEHHARVAAAYLCGQAEDADPTPWFWTDQYDVNAQFVGLPEHVDQVVWRDGPAGPDTVAVYLAGNRVVGGMTWNGAREMRFIRRLTVAGSRLTPGELADSAISLRHLAAT